MTTPNAWITESTVTHRHEMRVHHANAVWTTPTVSDYIAALASLSVEDRERVLTAVAVGAAAPVISATRELQIARMAREAETERANRYAALLRDALAPYPPDRSDWRERVREELK